VRVTRLPFASRRCKDPSVLRPKKTPQCRRLPKGEAIFTALFCNSPQEDSRFPLTLYNPVLHSVISRGRPNPTRQFVFALLRKKDRCWIG
jgi:hypothetical protein